MLKKKKKAGYKIVYTELSTSVGKDNYAVFINMCLIFLYAWKY